MLFARYERALVTNDVGELDALFWKSPHTLRYGATENLHGMDEIRAFRRARSPVGLARTVERTTITTFGRDFATATILFRRDSMPGKVGRQMQSWVRMADGWRSPREKDCPRSGEGCPAGMSISWRGQFASHAPDSDATTACSRGFLQQCIDRPRSLGA